ncbi:NEW3 domain-containing protein [Cohnella sp. GCM10027633]|uniref:COG1470 family protein n=1 Tax=unclassified Cohnella TaxID=2636738 RepID=UPI003644DF2D
MSRLTCKLKTHLVLALAVGLTLGLASAAAPASAASEAALYTPYTYLSASPGETLRYDIELINGTDDIRAAALSFDSGGKDWGYELTAGGHPIREIAVKGGLSETLTLSIDVPYEVSKGDYPFTLNAGSFGSLGLKVNVAEGGTYESELKIEQPNQQGHADTSFTYSLSLDNRTAAKQQYALAAEAPAGWDARFTVGGESVTSVDIESKASKTVTLALTPADSAKAGTYDIPVHAVSGDTSADAHVQAVITGTYGISLTTADERLSADITTGKERNLELVVKNTGSAELTDVTLTGEPPAKWDLSFEPKTIKSLKPGEQTTVTANVKASGKALAGDYVVSLAAQSSAKTADAAVRMTVKTSVLWGWVGVLIIAAVLGGVYALFRKYGRR